MRVERHCRDRLRSIPQEARVRLPLRHQFARVNVEELDLVALGADGEDGRVFVHAHRLEVVCRRFDGFDRLVHANVPEFDFAIAASGDELALSTALEVYVCDPLFMFFPHFDHCCCGFLSLIVDTDGAIAEPSYEDIPFDLV